MSYTKHFFALIAAFQAATGASDRALSMGAGLGESWLRQARDAERPTMRAADKMLAHILAEARHDRRLDGLVARIEALAPPAPDAGAAPEDEAA